MVLTSSSSCPVCKSSDIKNSIAINDMPVYCNVLFDNQENAVTVSKGDIHLGYCNDCGHVFNYAFDKSLMDYTADYENSLHFSPIFNQYAEELAQRLIDTYNIRGKEIVEIGCGKGDFLKMLCDRGENQGHGFDRSFDPTRNPDDVPKNITFHQDFFDEQYSHLNPELICCRHVLEHIDEPQAFLQNLREIIGGRNPVIYFEVPNALYTLKDLGIWDLIYEHCGYFTQNSLERVFVSSGYEILDIGESFGGQFLYIEARPTEDSTTIFSEDKKSRLQELAVYVNDFEANYNATVDKWFHVLNELRQLNSTAVVWGGGSKGVTFLNILKPGETISYVIDVNPHKHNKFVAGTGQQVKEPSFLKTYQPKKVVIMNPIYRDEIETCIKGLGLNIEVVCV
jgi:hypothetical protein